MPAHKPKLQRRDGLLLGFDPETAATLLLGRDSVVGDGFFALRNVIMKPIMPALRDRRAPACIAL